MALFICMIIATPIAFAGYLVTQYSFTWKGDDYASNPYRYSSNFYINSSVASVTGWQYSMNMPGAIISYAIGEDRWFTVNPITPYQQVSGDYLTNNWFSPLHFINIPQNTKLALIAQQDTSKELAAGGNVYDGY
ncbi:hypothetical protein [Neomoorella thermoacetica]|uniref:hypothetical protein n=2 Tax=Neomoorella thermoacetica TaxID=1525 RepID=UPI001119892C|nr:hypothetical protein [Moorella thermoacetica]